VAPKTEVLRQKNNFDFCQLKLHGIASDIYEYVFNYGLNQGL
jgi:hypothetical protein